MFAAVSGIDFASDQLLSFGAQAFAVVGDPDEQPFPFSACDDRDLPALVLESMQDGIFYQGLQEKARHQEAGGVRSDIFLQFDPRVALKVHQLQIMPHDFDLLMKGNKLILAVKGHSQQKCQGLQDARTLDIGIQFAPEVAVFIQTRSIRIGIDRVDDHGDNGRIQEVGDGFEIPRDLDIIKRFRLRRQPVFLRFSSASAK